MGCVTAVVVIVGCGVVVIGRRLGIVAVRVAGLKWRCKTRVRVSLDIRRTISWFYDIRVTD